MIGKLIVSRCASDTTITTLVGARIFPIIAPQNTDTPFLTYTVSDSPADTNKITAEKIYTCSVSIRAWCKVDESTKAYEKLETIRDAMRAEFNFDDTTAAGVTITGSQYQGSTDGLDESVTFFYKEMTFYFRLNIA